MESPYVSTYYINLKEKEMTREVVIQLIRHRKLSIRVMIFGGCNEDKLDIILKEVSLTGETRHLTRRDKYFTYCKERDVWYGNPTTWLPYIKLENLTNAKNI